MYILDYTIEDGCVSLDPAIQGTAGDVIWGDAGQVQPCLWLWSPGPLQTPDPQTACA